jgi:hypothetical protein
MNIIFSVALVISSLQSKELLAKLQGPASLTVKCTFSYTVNVDELKRLTGNTVTRSRTGEHLLYASNGKLRSELRTVGDSARDSLSIYNNGDCFVVYPTYDDRTGISKLLKKCNNVGESDFMTPSGHIIYDYFMPMHKFLSSYEKESKVVISEAVLGSLQSSMVTITSPNLQFKCEIQYGKDGYPQTSTNTMRGRISTITRYSRKTENAVSFLLINYNNEIEINRYTGEFTYDTNDITNTAIFEFAPSDATYIMEIRRDTGTGDYVYFCDGIHYPANTDKSIYKNVQDALSTRSVTASISKTLIACGVVAFVLLAITLISCFRFRRTLFSKETP